MTGLATNPSNRQHPSVANYSFQRVNLLGFDEILCLGICTVNEWKMQTANQLQEESVKDNFCNIKLILQALQSKFNLAVMLYYAPFVFALLCPLPSFSAEGEYTKAETNLNTLAIIKPNEYKLDEVPKNIGVNWLALVKSSNEQWSLFPATAKNGECSVCGLSDRKITSNQPNALFLLRHKDLKPGPVHSSPLNFGVYAGAHLFENSSPVDMKFNGREYRFAWGEKRSKITTLEDGEKIDSGYRSIVLIRGEEKQIIGKRPLWNDEGTHMLAWAGDLDGDGLLDFIIEDSFYNGSLTCLYLSSPAPKNKLVKRVSCYSTSGC